MARFDGDGARLDLGRVGHAGLEREAELHRLAGCDLPLELRRDPVTPSSTENVPTDQYRVTVSVPYHVDGEDAGYLWPGEAVDRVLPDDAFRSQLEAISRERWNGSGDDIAGG